VFIVLCVCALLVLYVYVAYPLLLKALASLRGFDGRAVETVEFLPDVSLIIPAYNERTVIRRKLENSLAIDYPSDRIEIVVASDGSDDGTEAIVEGYAPRGIVLSASSPRAGKISVLNRAVPQARGEIVVLCDANVMFHPDAVRRLVAHFADPRIGAVTGDVRIQSEDAPFGEGEGFYYKYERFLQSKESELGSTVTVDGGMYAIRKELFRPLPADTILDDFVIGMNVALAGRRVIYDPEILATENATTDVGQEFRRKVRIVAGAFRELLRRNGVPGLRHGQVFWSYVSHKLLRWLTPWFLMVIFGCSLALLRDESTRSWALVLLAPQLGFYAAALIGATRPNARWPAVVGIPFYFCMVNAAAWLGSIRGALGVEQVTWRKAAR